ncbi:MAG: hypothetical protein HY859_02725 [Caulobacterales bacterium]|nr:hypothetical protein [Caulobacterales bacterium]
MKRGLFLIAAVTLGMATSATAGDRIYRGGTMLTEDIAGQPYWAVQAQCAGVYGAASSYLADKGDADGAATAKAMGVAFFRDAVERVMKDRGVARPAAIEALSPTVISGRAKTLEALQAEGDGPNSKWNYARSACLDMRETYRAN